MPKHILRSIALGFVIAGLVLSTGPLGWAKHEGKGEGHGGGHQGTPPGWEHGKKKGWHGGDMPPGLAKKEGKKVKKHKIHAKKHKHHVKKEVEKEKES